MAVIDTLRLARALRDRGGFTEPAAEATAEALNAALGGDVATKGDVELVKVDIAAVRAELKADIAAVRTELKADIAAVRTELKADIEAVKSDIRLLQWQIAIMYALQIAILVKLFVH
jgi:hypothetical protein